MVPRGGIEPPTLRFSGTFLVVSSKYLAMSNVEKQASLGLWMAK
jgi:hypothetical protein